MKKLCFTLLLAALFLQARTLNAKNDSTSVIRNGLGINIAPIFSLPTFVNQNNYQQNAVKGGIGFTAALCHNIVLSKKHNLYIYNELGYMQNAYADQVPAVVVNGNTNSASVKFATSYSSAYFSLSIQKVLFKISNKLGIFLGVGAQASYLFGITQVVEYVDANGNKNTQTYTSSGSNINQDYQWAAAALARLGFVATPVKHLSISAAPIFYYGLNPNLVFKNNQPGYNSFGLNLQLMFNF